MDNILNTPESGMFRAVSELLFRWQAALYPLQ